MPKGLITGSACKGCGKPLGVRNKLGHCIGCRTDELRRLAMSHDPIRPFYAERVAYYAARAALGLDLFAESPWRRKPGAHNRLEEVRPESTGATCRIAAAHQVE